MGLDTPPDSTAFDTDTVSPSGPTRRQRGEEIGNKEEGGDGGEERSYWRSTLKSTSERSRQALSRGNQKASSPELKPSLSRQKQNKGRRRGPLAGEQAD